jgi:indole-3-glycerol phosphate synthase/phosphoribosylanthranilate isomerase
MPEPVGVLAQIVVAKRNELARRFDGISLDALRAKSVPTRRSLASALGRPGARFILEIKKASPSQGAIRVGANPAALARGYAGIADALSVLCDRAYFGGSLADLAAARPEFDGPILAKDFFLDPRQVAEARIAGADAILVMLSLLDDEPARAMITEAHRFGMEALVEVHNEVEMRRALALRAPVIGINNRDLRDLSIDLATTERLAKFAPDCILVSESGIESRADVDRLAPEVDAFLVGSSLMRAPSPAEAARALVFGRTKLCGLNRAEDFEAAGRATHVGLVMVPDSPRGVTVGQALRLAPLHPAPVGVFRNAPVETVAEAATMMGLVAVQLHGDEDVGFVRQLARRLPAGCEIWKAVEVGRSAPGRFDAADRLLFDSRPGGTGKTFDWSLIRGHPQLSGAIVAGGIGPDNVRRAQQLGAYVIDVGSSLDQSPGRKSPDRIAALFDALRPPSRQPLRECA